MINLSRKKPDPSLFPARGGPHVTSNAILIANEYCPISFRTVDSVEYKKAMLIFYEQNNIAAFKKIFIDQFAFAVRTYF